MAFKFIALFALVAVSSAAVLPSYEAHQQPALFKAYQPAPVYAKAIAAPVYKQVQYQDAPAEYEFAYDVHDDHTGDIHSQKESRHGDNVQGEYSLIDADGYRRTVTYTADEEHGFLATVRREPVEGHKVVAAAPVVKYAVAPVVKYAAAPVVKTVQYAAPAYKVAAAPVHYTAPAYKVAAAPVHYTAPAYKVAAAPAYKVAVAPAAYKVPVAQASHDAYNHVSFQGQGHDYHY